MLCVLTKRDSTYPKLRKLIVTPSIQTLPKQFPRLTVINLCLKFSLINLIIDPKSIFKVIFIKLLDLRPINFLSYCDPGCLWEAVSGQKVGNLLVGPLFNSGDFLFLQGQKVGVAAG